MEALSFSYIWLGRAAMAAAPAGACGCWRRARRARVQPPTPPRGSRRAAARACEGAAGARDAAALALFSECSGGAAVAVPAAPSAARGRALVASRAAGAGSVLLRVPDALALCVGGARVAVPRGRWPRLRRGVEAGGALPAEVHLARALLDARAGEGGGGLWGDYVGRVLPRREELTMPLVAEDATLGLLAEGDALRAEVEAERGTLRVLGGDLEAEEDLEWAFALARSRALTAGGGWAAMVPGVDLANHAASPSADYRCFGVITPPRSGERLGFREEQDPDAFELVALRDIAEGEEICICYGSGAEEWTLGRTFAQYGFCEDAQIVPVAEALGGGRAVSADDAAIEAAGVALKGAYGGDAAAEQRAASAATALRAARALDLAEGGGGMLTASIAAGRADEAAAAAEEAADAARARAVAGGLAGVAIDACLQYNDRRAAALATYADLLEALTTA